MVLQPDQRMLMGGRDASDFLLIRYLPDGSLDPSFGVGGRVSTELGSDADGIRELVLLDDGRILAAGYTSVAGGSVALVRYLPDGTADATFGSGGIVTTSIGPATLVGALAVQADGKIVVATERDAQDDLVLVRYTSDGALDTTFDGDGMRVIDIDPGLHAFERPSDLVIRPDGTLLLVGSGSSGGTLYGFVARLADDGSLDLTFGSAGIAVLAGTPLNAGILQADGALVVAGSREPSLGADHRPTLARLAGDGSLDLGFAEQGVYDGAAIGRGAFHDLAFEPDGQIVAAGERFTFDADFLLARFDADGALDPNFARCAVTVTSMPDLDHDTAFAVALQSDGKIVAGGISDFRFALARYGTPPLPACAPAASGRAKLVFRGSGKVVWKWQGSPVMPDDLGDPTIATGYRFCMLDGAGRPVLQATVPSVTDRPEAWTATATGFKFRQPFVLPDGVTKMLLRALPTGVGKLALSLDAFGTGGGYLGTAVGPFPPPVRAQLLRGDDQRCFEATFSAPKKNTAQAFRATSD